MARVTIRPIHRVARTMRFALRSATSVCSETPIPRILIEPLSVIVFIRSGLTKRVYVLVVLMVVTVSLTTLICLVRIWKGNKEA